MEKLNNLMAYLFFGTISYFTYSLISSDLHFQNWHWTLRTFYVFGGVYSFVKIIL